LESFGGVVQMYLFHLSNLPFALIMAASFFFLALQGLGGEQGSDHELEHGGDTEATEGELENPWLGFINLGKLPLSILMILLFFFWGASGLLLNTALSMQLQAHSVWVLLLSLGMGLATSAFLTRFFSGVFARFFVESSAATTPDDLVGCVGTVISGQVPPSGGAGSGRAHIYTTHGTLLQIACLTHPGCQNPQKQETVFVTGYDPVTRNYTVLRHESEDFFHYLGAPERTETLRSRLEQSRKYQVLSHSENEQNLSDENERGNFE